MAATGMTATEMTATSEATDAAFDIEAARNAYMAELVEAGLLIPTGVPGINGRSAAFEWIVEGIVRAVAHRSAADSAELVRFPDRKSTRLNSSHPRLSRMPSSA